MQLARRTRLETRGLAAARAGRLELARRVATVIAFTTGRGSVFGSRPAPTVKLGTNTDLAARMAGDIDLDCSGVLEQGVPLADMGREVYDLLLDVAGGQRSLSEELGLGGEEMVPWQIGAVL